MPLSDDQRQDLQTLASMDPILEYLMKTGRPLTRENYLNLAYPSRPDAIELDAEEEAELPEFLQMKS